SEASPGTSAAADTGSVRPPHGTAPSRPRRTSPTRRKHREAKARRRPRARCWNSASTFSFSSFGFPLLSEQKRALSVANECPNVADPLFESFMPARRCDRLAEEKRDRPRILWSPCGDLQERADQPLGFLLRVRIRQSALEHSPFDGERVAVDRYTSSVYHWHTLQPVNGAFGTC